MTHATLFDAIGFLKCLTDAPMRSKSVLCTLESVQKMNYVLLFQLFIIRMHLLNPALLLSLKRREEARVNFIKREGSSSPLLSDLVPHASIKTIRSEVWQKHISASCP